MKAKILILAIICSTYAQVNLSEDGRLNFTDLATKYGQKTEEYDIVTTDGYILKLFHMIGDKSRPILLVHGAIDSSDDFILRGNRSIGIILANRGYDVWAINHRGNRYSRRHTTLNPDTDAAFWDFSMTEFGEKDLPSVIDFIKERTAAKISLIGYSEGSTSTLIMGANRPEYNDRISVFIAIAPVCYIHNTRQHVIMSTVMALAPHLNRGLRRTHSEEFVGFTSPIRKFVSTMCSMRISYDVCVMLGIFPLTGFNQKQLEPSFLPVLLGHFPAGTSRKNLYHFVQIWRRRIFADYDYGSRNFAKYGSSTPPVFPLSKVTMKVAIFTARNDRIATMEDVSLLRSQLPNVVADIVLKRMDFNHFDFVLGRSSYKVTVPHVLDILEKFSY